MAWTDRLICIDTVDKQSEPVSKLFGMLAVLGLRSGADQLLLQPGEEDYRLTFKVGVGEYDIVGPPIELRQRIQDVARAIIGGSRPGDESVATTNVVIRQTDLSPAVDWPMSIMISDGPNGDNIVFHYPGEGQPDWPLIRGLAQSVGTRKNSDST